MQKPTNSALLSKENKPLTVRQPSATAIAISQERKAQPTQNIDEKLSRL